MGCAISCMGDPVADTKTKVVQSRRDVKSFMVTNPELDKLRSLTYKGTPTFGFADMKFAAKCVKVYDGDTITVAFKMNGNYYKKSARMLNYDSPEMNPKYSEADMKELGITTELIEEEGRWAKEAKELLAGIVLDKIIMVEHASYNDKYGRLLINVKVGDDDVNKIMLLNGYSRPYDGGKKLKWDFSGFEQMKIKNDIVFGNLD